MDRKLWAKPWGYIEGYFIAFGLLFTGFALEIITKGKEINLSHYPYNFIALGILIAIIFVLYVFFSKNHVVRWLSSVPAALSSIGLLTFLSMLLGFIAQDDKTASTIVNLLRLSHLTSSYPFAFSLIFFLLTLGLVIIRRANKITVKNSGFLLNHIGLWVTIAAASLGSGDIYRLRMSLYENENYNYISYDNSNKAYEMNFALKLLKFKIDQYSPNIVIVNEKTRKALPVKGKSVSQLAKGLVINNLNWEIKVLEYYFDALPNSKYKGQSPDVNEGNMEFIQKDSLGSAPAAYVIVTNKITNQTKSGWITCGSFMFNSEGLSLEDDFVLLMTSSEAKKYSSKLQYITKDNKEGTFLLQVNKPFSLNNWKIYQIGYDENLGKWSNLSIVELVKDPWLTWVYIGMGMLLIGAGFIFITGRKPMSSE